VQKHRLLYWRKDTTSLGKLGLLMDMIPASILVEFAIALGELRDNEAQG
jgi:hypothetical protein